MKRLTLIVTSLIIIASLALSACGGAAKKAKVRVATDATWPPFEMVNEQSKQIEGFDVDLMNAVAAKGGFEIEYINVAFDPLLAGMAQCQYDAAISAMTITEDRKKSFLFSDPYFGAGQLVVVRTDNADISSKDSLSGKKVGAQVGTTGALEAENMAGVTLTTYDDIGLAFQDLMNGQVDAVIADDGLARGYISKNNTKIKAAGEPFTNEAYGIAVCNKNADLLGKINKGLAAVKADGLIEQLTQKWLVGGN